MFLRGVDLVFYSLVYGFGAVEFSNFRLGEGHKYSDVMIGAALLSAPVSTADLVTPKLQTMYTHPSPFHHTQ
jgi:hypothetical protein